MKSSKVLNIPIKGVYDDRVQIEALTFDPFTLTTSNPETVMLLLESTEKDIVLKVIAHLDIYCDKLSENALKLNDLQIIELILNKNLTKYPDLFIQRFALKIISKILQIEQPKPAKISNYTIIEEILDISKSYYIDFNSDNYLVEYSTICLVGLLKEPRVLMLLEIDNDFIMKIFERLRYSKDPDILFHSYELILKILRCSTSLTEFCLIEGFPFERLLGDITCEYPEIQLIALELINELCNCQNTLQYRLVFICPIFFEQLCQILNDETTNEILLLPIVKIFQKLMKSEEFAKIFTMGPYLNIFIEFTKSYANKIEAITVFCIISEHEIFLDILYQSGVLTLLLDILMNNCFDMTSSICLGIKRMMNQPDSYPKIINANPVPCLINIIENNSKDWPTREAALDCLHMLAKRNLDVCEAIIKNNYGKLCDNFFNTSYGEIRPDFLISLTKVLNDFAPHPDLRIKIMDGKLCNGLITAIKNSKRSAILLTNFLNCASAFIIEDTLKDYFLSQNLSIILLPALNSPALIVQTAASDFIILTGKLVQFADKYIDNGVLSKLLSDEKSLSICPTWTLAIEAILSANPSLKFCIRGRLGLTDLIHSDFYISKKHWKDFNIFRSIIQNNVSPLFPLILVNFNNTEVRYSKTFSVCCGLKNEDSDTTKEEWVFCRYPIDLDLPIYLSKLRELLEIRGLMDDPKQKNSIDITNITDRGKVIAEIVCNEMCGIRRGLQTQVCSEHVVLNHLNYLKSKLHCNIIPLGSIRVGGYFERSVLFKALADQIGFPCTLQKSIDGRILYNEIPIPTLEKDPKCGISILPRRLLNPTHIIDLMNNPGELYPINSQKAFQYIRLI